MALPHRLLDVVTDGETVRPRFLGRHDERWVGAVLGVMEDLAGERASAAAAAFHGPVLGIGRAFDVAPRALELLFRLERARFAAAIDAPAPPELIRDVVFDLAAKLPRAEALRAAAACLDVDARAMERALFADRKDARVLVRPVPWSTPPAAVLRYNHALAGALLARATRVAITVGGDACWLVARVKRLGLSPVLTRDASVSHLVIEARYAPVKGRARALAKLLPLLVATREWSLTADVALRGEGARRLDLDATAPLVSDARAYFLVEGRGLGPSP